MSFIQINPQKNHFIWIVCIAVLPFNIICSQINISISFSSSLSFGKQSEFESLVKNKFTCIESINFIPCISCEKESIGKMDATEINEFIQNSINFQNRKKVDFFLYTSNSLDSFKNKTNLNFRILSTKRSITNTCTFVEAKNLTKNNLDEKAASFVEKIISCIEPEMSLSHVVTECIRKQKKNAPPPVIVATEAFKFTKIKDNFEKDNFTYVITVLNNLSSDLLTSDSLKQLRYYYLGLSYFGAHDYEMAISTLEIGRNFKVNKIIEKEINLYLAFINKCKQANSLNKKELYPIEWFYGNTIRSVKWWKKLPNNWKKSLKEKLPPSFYENDLPTSQGFEVLFSLKEIPITHDVNNFMPVSCLTKVKKFLILKNVEIGSKEGIEYLPECLLICFKNDTIIPIPKRKNQKISCK